MNERIRELITQVGTCPSGKWVSVDDVEKLVKLIVQDFVEQTDLVQSQTISNGSDDYVNGRQMGIEVVKRRIQMIFGVEQ
jgi:hypothetical protein